MSSYPTFQVDNPQAIPPSRWITHIIEYLVGNIHPLKSYISLLSLATAILLTFAFQVSLFSLVLGTAIKSPFWEFLLSAFIIARLSNYLNDLVQKFLEVSNEFNFLILYT